MGRIPGVNHLHAIRALEKAGFRIVREGKHTVMSDGERILTIPRHNPVNAFTMGGIVREAVPRYRPHQMTAVSLHIAADAARSWPGASAPGFSRART